MIDGKSTGMNATLQCNKEHWDRDRERGKPVRDGLKFVSVDQLPLPLFLPTKNA